jgi:hypothetical protein
MKHGIGLPFIAEEVCAAPQDSPPAGLSIAALAKVGRKRARRLPLPE